VSSAIQGHVYPTTTQVVQLNISAVEIFAHSCFYSSCIFL